ncbi:hypothetical protein [Shewanella putrefaciens]|uniref:ASP external chaperone domain-containing protein n=2 Tax=Shewanella putrefaciens TaxID=24 RepID=E6XIA4_SHEP2|nr:hypothetical protein [Shewanella putrefaciens]CAD6365441.1 hypothetical protein SHEWT2_00617 [Shewanella hafniensis]AVV82606.1 hypothetical protein SPWS13_0782 [Shewanella putrefaciens]MCA1895806.1 hypothetical protein [Shewanella putrefaciens]MCT8941965.1 hypothetical protein [Shewanella putrefaciens]QSE50972.1 hypothetical protein JW975_08335 [Shewanella putrefaciens]
MKALNLSLVAVALSLSAQAMAHNKVDFTEPQAESKEMSRGEFLGTDIQYYVKTETGIKQAKQLVKGQKVVTQSGTPFAEMTGKLVVKLKPGVSATDFAKAHGLRVDWQNNNNLLLLAAKEGTDLIGLIQAVKASPEVERAKLDRALAKQEIQ